VNLMAGTPWKVTLVVLDCKGQVLPGLPRSHLGVERERRKLGEDIQSVGDC
jgi:hypothetical protein